MVPRRYDVLGLCNVTEGVCQLPREPSFDIDAFLGEIFFFSLFDPPPIFGSSGPRGSKQSMPLDSQMVVSYASIIYFGIIFLTVSKLFAILGQFMQFGELKWLPFGHF